MIARALRSIADLLDPPRREAPRSPIRFEGPTIFDLDAAKNEARQTTALSLLDDDVIAYVLIVARRTTLGTAQVELDVAADDPIWPALSETAARVVLEGARVFGEQA